MTRVSVITGGSSGIGLAAAVAMARRGDEVVLIGRNQARLGRAVDTVRDIVGHTPASYRADFAHLDEVHAVAERIGGDFDRIDVLANNAGQLGPWTRRTGDGFDVTMQVNHLAGFVLSHLLLDLLRQAPDPRLITTASIAEAWAWLDVADPTRLRLRNRSRWLAYGSSKQANILFTVEAARRWGPLGITAVSFFPGLVRTRFASSSPMFMLGKLIPVLVTSPTRAADTLVWLSAAPGLINGGYYFMRTLFAATPRATDPRRAAALWRSSMKAAGLGTG